MRLVSGVFVCVCLLQAATAGAQVVRGGDLPGPLPLFPRSNWWNTDISLAPVDSSSASLLGFIGNVGLHPDFGGDSSPAPEIYGFPYVVVPGSQPLEIADFYAYDDESDHAAPGRPPGYPIPVDAKTGTKWIEGGYAANDPAADGDRHMLIVDRDNRVLFEMGGTQYNTVTGHWEAAGGAIFPLDSNARRQDTWTSADAAGLAILPGLIRYDEVASGQPITHAFRFTVPSTNGYVYPASHVAGNTAGAPPMGTRLRLKAGKNITGFAPEMQRIFQAMKTYGLILADNGTAMYISGTYDTRWNNDILNPAFSALTTNDFEVVQLGWAPEPARRDFSDDARNDILLRYTPSNALGMWTMNGPSISGSASVAAMGSYSVAATADFDADGQADILLRDSLGNLGVWFMNGSLIRSGAYVGSPGGYTVAGAADLDGDGHADIVLRDGGGNVGVWFMNGTTITSGAFIGSAAGYSVAAVADFNGDTKADILMRDSSGNLGMWLMNGSTIIAGAFVGAPGAYAVAGVGDFNGDGKADILLRDSLGNLGMWLMNGPVISSGAFVGAPGPYNVAAVADFNGDHRADILLRHATTGDVGMWLMNGPVVTTGSLVSSLDNNYEIVP